MSFFLLLNTKEDIPNNVDNQTVDSRSMVVFHSMEVNGYRQLFGYQHCSKYQKAVERNVKTMEQLDGKYIYFHIRVNNPFNIEELHYEYLV